MKLYSLECADVSLRIYSLSLSGGRISTYMPLFFALTISGHKTVQRRFGRITERNASKEFMYPCCQSGQSFHVC